MLKRKIKKLRKTETKPKPKYKLKKPDQIKLNSIFSLFFNFGKKLNRMKPNILQQMQYIK